MGYQASCHCGAVEVTVDVELPAQAIDCNCSHCRDEGLSSDLRAARCGHGQRRGVAWRIPLQQESDRPPLLPHLRCAADRRRAGTERAGRDDQPALRRRSRPGRARNPEIRRRQPLAALPFCSPAFKGAVSKLAASRAARNPCGHLARRRRRGPRGERGEAIARAAETPHIILNAPLIGQRLGYPELSGLDLLELFAFVHPARFAVPTPAGLSRALGLDPPGDEADAAAALQRHGRAAARAGSAIPTGAEREGAWTVNSSLARLGWRWAPLVGARLERPERGERMLFSRLKQWEEARRAAAAAAVRVAPADAEARLDGLTGSASRAREGQRAMAGAVAGGVRSAPVEGRAQHAAGRGGHRDRQDAGLSRAGLAVGEGRAGRCGCRPSPRRCSASSMPKGHKLFADPAERARRIVIRKGRENYLCLLNLEDALQGAFAGRAAILAQLVGRWAAYTRDGDMVGGDLPGWLPSLFRRAGAAALTDRRGECVYRRLPALPPLLHRARRAGRPRGRHRHRQPRAGDDQRRPQARAAPRRIVFDEGHHLFDAADSTFAVASAGRKRSRCGAGSSGRKAGRAAAAAGSPRG